MLLKYIRIQQIDGKKIDREESIIQYANQLQTRKSCYII